MDFLFANGLNSFGLSALQTGFVSGSFFVLVLLSVLMLHRVLFCLSNN